MASSNAFSSSLHHTTIADAEDEDDMFLMNCECERGEYVDGFCCGKLFLFLGWRKREGGEEEEGRCVG